MPEGPGKRPGLGFGVGLRNTHFNHILAHRPAVDWFEAITENFMDSGGRPRAVLHQIAVHYPVVLHGVSLSIGSTDPLDLAYVRRVRELADDIGARWVSDHLCWTGVLGVNSHDLLPLPLNDATLAHVAGRVQQVQELLRRPLVLENPSTYLRFRNSNLSEPDFLRALCAATGCRLLLDVNNLYVSAFNAGTDPWAYLEAFPLEQVVQFHLAGHEHCGTHIVDTHDQPVCDAVWALYAQAARRCPTASTLVEWDGNIPSFERLHAEARRASSIMADSYGVEETEANTMQATPEQPPSASFACGALSTPLDFMVTPVMRSSHLFPTP